MRDNLLKEAIADAKAIRDAAVAQAKASLEESFKPHLSAMLSQRLRTEIGLNENNDDTSAIGGGAVTVKNPGPKEPSAATSDSSHIENKGIEVEKIFGEAFEEEPRDDVPPAEDTPMGAPDMGGAPAGMDGAPSPAAPAAAPQFGAAPQMGGAPDMGMGAQQAGIEGDELGADELDLDAIIRELELDLQGGQGAPADGQIPAPVAPEMEQPVAESFSDVKAGQKVTGPLDGSNIQETLSGDGDEGVFKDGQAPTAKDGVNGGREVKPGTVVTGTAADTMTEGEEVDLDEILREMEAEDESPVLESEKIALENVELRRALAEHRKAVSELKGMLSEVNLLNSKLVFTNKLFKNYNLDMNQKVRVVETFDRAASVREVKLIYTTLAENFNGKIGTVTKKVAGAKTITEGMASKSTGSTKPKSTPVLAEGNDMVARMQKLAGIKLS